MHVLWWLLFGTALALLAWSYLLYPALVLWLGRRTPGAATAVPTAVPTASATPPRVAVLIAAFNEEAHIGARVRNLQAQGFPAERFQVLIGSDGSSDGTVAAAIAAQSTASMPAVRVAEFHANRGKASVLNDLCALTDAELLVFTDANTEFATDTLQRLVEPFADPQVGSVCGELRLLPPGAGGNQDHVYWSVERRLKAAESRLGGLLGANGGVYAIRRELYRPLEPDMICDDFVIAMNVAAAGWKNVYCAAALAFERAPDDEAAEFHRRVRIGIGNYQALFRRPEYLLRAPWILRLCYLSHKVLRWFTPLWLLCLLLGSAGLRAEPLFAACLWMQVAGYVSAALIYVTRRALPWPAALRGGMLFVALNAAFTVAFVRFLRGNYGGSWRRTVRA